MGLTNLRGDAHAEFRLYVLGHDSLVAHRLFLGVTPGNGLIGGSTRALFNGMTYVHGEAAGTLTVSHLAPTIPETVYAMFQMTFAIITPALIAGAFADRMKFSAMLVFLSAWSLLVYAPIAHMVWEPHGLAQRGRASSITPAEPSCTSMRALRASPAAWYSVSAWGTVERRCRRTT